MAKGQMRSNKEAKKPKAAKPKTLAGSAGMSSAMAKPKAGMGMPGKKK